MYKCVFHPYSYEYWYEYWPNNQFAEYIFFQSENQENARVSSEKHAVVYAIAESQKRGDRSPLHPIELNFPHRQSLSSSGAPKTDSGLQLRESWKR